MGHELHQIQVGQGNREPEIGHGGHRGEEALEVAAGAPENCHG
jgi:hypothetical protein